MFDDSISGVEYISAGRLVRNSIKMDCICIIYTTQSACIYRERIRAIPVKTLELIMIKRRLFFIYVYSLKLLASLPLLSSPQVRRFE